VKVTLERHAGKAKTGIFFGSVHAYMIDLQVTFTETELAAIKEANLKDYVLIERPYHPALGNDVEQFKRMANDTLRVSSLLGSHTEQKPRTVFWAASQPEADMAEHKLREALQDLKRLIERTTEPRPAKDSYEL